MLFPILKSPYLPYIAWAYGLTAAALGAYAWVTWRTYRAARLAGADEA